MSKVICEGDLQIAIFNLGGNLYAIDNACPHSGGPLAKGELRGEVVECPWHGWSFNIRTGSSPIIPEASIKTYPVRVQGENVLVGLDLP
jgi:nitrite reductase (NADH) small subunit